MGSNKNKAGIKRKNKKKQDLTVSGSVGVLEKLRRNTEIIQVKTDPRKEQGVKQHFQLLWEDEKSDFAIHYIFNVWGARPFWDVSMRYGDVMIWLEIYKSNISKEEMVEIACYCRIHFFDFLKQSNRIIAASGSEYFLKQYRDRNRAYSNVNFLRLYRESLQSDTKDGTVGKKIYDVNVFFGYREGGKWTPVYILSDTNAPKLKQPGTTFDASNRPKMGKWRF